MSPRPEDARETARPSGVAGSKRRSRLSTASAAITTSEIPESSMPSVEPASNSTTADPAQADTATYQRPRRASRVLSHIRDGFRRSGSTRSITARSSDPTHAMGINASTGTTSATDQNADTAAMETSSIAQVADQTRNRQDKKRRRIGDYAGPSESGGSNDVSASNSDDAVPVQQSASSVPSTKASTPPLLSPPVVPLTETDPLLDDRLRSLEAIRSVLGDDVARRLPSVESLRELSRSQAAPARSVENGSSVALSGTAETHQVGEGERREGAISLPPSTLELLNELDREHTSPAEEASLIPTASTVFSNATADSTASAHDQSMSSQQRERRARRSSLRNFTNRLGGWLGVGPSRNESGVAADESTGDGAMDVDTSDPVGDVASAPAQEATAAQEPDSSMQREPSAPSQRLATGAVMIVQGFVQTTVPARERRRSRPTPANPVTRPESQPPFTRSGMRRTMSQPGTSTSSSVPIPTLAEALRSPQSLRRSPPSSGAATPVPGSRPVRGRNTRSGSATPLDTARWGQSPIDEEAIASRERAPRGINRPGTPTPGRELNSSPPVVAAVPAERADSGIRSSIRDRNVAREQAEQVERSGAEPDGRPEPPSFAEQARMLGGLLSVATAATATSLLSQGTQINANDTSSPASTSQARASGPRAALEALRNRLRSSNHSASTPDAPNAAQGTAAPVPDRGVEDVLREYMRHAMANSRNASRSSAGAGSPTAPMLSTILPTTDPASFEAFLNDMQTSLIQALSAFAEERDVEEERGSGNDNPDAEAASSNQPTTTDPSTSGAPTTATQGNPQPAGESQEPRRLNFFRIFQFPARPNPPAQPSDPAVDLIPVVIVGVRSMNRDINTVTAENVAAAPFPFNHTDNIQGTPPSQEVAPAPPPAREDIFEPNPLTPPSIVPSVPSARRTPSATTATTARTATTTPSATAAPTAPTAPERAEPNHERRGSWGSRALRSINRLRRPRAARTTSEAGDADSAFTRNYVLWVVGGNYPAGHPILTIPHLFTGELSHEDLWTLAEALGQVKPPVASRADIENSGLAVIKGGQVKDEGASGAILAICVEQCLICLSDYEDEVESEVRVMKCRHAFHKSCVDEWMVVGRNSCPACRQTGVEISSEGNPQPVATESSASPQDDDVNMTS